MDDDFFHGLVTTLLSAAAALAPSAIGATIAAAMKQGITWTERLLQIFIGICVSWYARAAIEAIWSPDPFVAQSIAFVAGLLAYDVLPKLRERAVARLVELPDALADWLVRRKRDDK